MRVTVMPIVVGVLGTVKRTVAVFFKKRLEELEMGKKNRNHGIVKIDQNTEKSLGD